MGHNHSARHTHHRPPGWHLHLQYAGKLAVQPLLCSWTRKELGIMTLITFEKKSGREQRTFNRFVLVVQVCTFVKLPTYLFVFLAVGLSACLLVFLFFLFFFGLFVCLSVVRSLQSIHLVLKFTPL